MTLESFQQLPTESRKRIEEIVLAAFQQGRETSEEERAEMKRLGYEPSVKGESK